MHLKFIWILLLIALPGISAAQHYKKDGTPDRRYKENKTYHAPVKSVKSSSASHYKTYRERDKHGRIKRSSSARREFMKLSGFPHGRKGYVIDHIIPLKDGGCDCPSNMQWQTIEAAKQKDKWEVP